MSGQRKTAMKCRRRGCDGTMRGVFQAYMIAAVGRDGRPVEDGSESFHSHDDFCPPAADVQCDTCQREPVAATTQEGDRG